MANVVDPRYFQELSEKDPAVICALTGCRYDDVNHRYTVTLWNHDYVIDPMGQTIERISEHGLHTHEFVKVFIMHYMLNTHPIDVLNQWVSEKDIPGGSAFFLVSHEIPCYLICDKYENDLDRFKADCQGMGGTALDMADAAYCFSVTPDVPVAVLYWQGDDDFPPEAKLLFDKSIALFPLDVIFALAIEVCTRLGQPLKPFGT